MNIQNNIVKLGIIFVLVFNGLMVMANALSYKQTSCEYAPNDRYIWIKLDNGVEKRGIAFVSDAVIFESSVFGMTYAKRYPDITKVTYGRGKERLGLLSVEFTQHGKIEREDVGSIDEECWKNIKVILAENPDSRHIKIHDEGVPARQSLN